MILRPLGRKLCLYIDTKDRKIITVSLKKDGKIVNELSEENEYGSQVLLPLIMKLLPSQGWDVVEGIEVEEGPGSYTGLKVGAAVAQALGFVLNIPVNGKINKPVKLKYT